MLKANLVRERTTAVSPIVGGVALKGPTVEMMRALGLDATPLEVARRYRDVSSRFVLDRRDLEYEAAIAQLRDILADATLYARDPARFEKASAMLADAETGLAAAEDRWLALEMLREAQGA